MLIIKAVYNFFISIFYFYRGSYDKSLYYSKRTASSYIKSKIVFSSASLERHISKCCDKVVSAQGIKCHTNIDNGRVGILASTIFDAGGHTECLMRFAESFCNDYELYLFLSNTHGNSRDEAKVKYEYLKTKLSINEVNTGSLSEKITELISAILKARVKMLFVYMHMDDVVSCAILSYFAKHSSIKIIFFNHGDHAFSLGFESANLIIELRKQGQFITQHYRKKMNTTLIPLQGVPVHKMITYTEQERSQKRAELGLIPGDLVSLSGFASYKVFRDKKNCYLIFIRELLLEEPRLKHIMVSDISSKERSRIDKVFKNHDYLLDRFLIVDRVPDFDLLLQAADVFIDSFPLGSALVHIDSIRNKLPTIIKKNSRNELYTFYTYLYDNYEYAMDDMDELLRKTLYLLRNKDERERIKNRSFSYYLDTYDFDKIKFKYSQLIENSQSLCQFHTPLPPGYTCRISI